MVGHACHLTDAALESWSYPATGLGLLVIARLRPVARVSRSGSADNCASACVRPCKIFGLCKKKLCVPLCSLWPPAMLWASCALTATVGRCHRDLQTYHPPTANTLNLKIYCEMPGHQYGPTYLCRRWMAPRTFRIVLIDFDRFQREHVLAPTLQLSEQH